MLRGTRALAVRAAVLAVLALTLLTAAPGGAVADDGGPPDLPPAGAPWFGPGLDVDADEPAGYADRLGVEPALYTVAVGYPLTDDDRDSLDLRVERLAEQGAVAVVDVQPRRDLEDLTADDAAELADAVTELHDRTGTFFLLRFAAEMNGSWKAWGQRPRAYVTAFRTVADALHEATDQAAMVWAPVYGSGYPFGRSHGRLGELESDRAGQLDTNGDRRVTQADDPYGPYWPGAEAADWVGLTLYRLGQAQGRQVNTLPVAGEYRARLDERWGYGEEASRPAFYDRFAEGEEKPMLVETSAGYNGAVGGAAELPAKRTWWRQVFAANADHPRIRAISYLEQERVEPEVSNEPLDWRATRTGPLARALLADAEAAGLTLGPVAERYEPTAGDGSEADREEADEAPAQGRLPGARYLGDSMGWTVVGAVALALLLLLSGLVGRLVPRWRYDEGGATDTRDLRLDLLRGLAIVALLVTQVELAGPYSYVALNLFGAISGAELFVLLSGVVIGTVHRSRVADLGEWVAATLRWRRAWTYYVTAVVAAFLVFGLGKIPGVDATAVTTFTDRGSGGGGPGAGGRVHDLYPDADRLLDHPPPWYAVRSLLLLEIGPWVLSILGLFVVLLTLAPALLFLLRRRLWWVVLALSWAAYLYGVRSGAHWLPSQFEDVFPVLVWQVVFVHGLVLGHHRRKVVSALTSRAGKAVTAVVVVAYGAALVWLWASHAALLPGPWPSDAYPRVYDHLYQRVDLQPGRLVDLALVAVAGFAVLTTCWRPVHRAVGWLLVPLGQASLYVFIVHVFLVVAVDNVRGLDRGSVWQGVVLHTLVLAAVWLLVRYRVLFSVIPR